MVWRKLGRMQARGVAAAILASLVGIGAMPQAWSIGPAPAARPAPAPRYSYESEDHFPGAAAYTAVADEAASATGSTGTTALPEQPVPDAAPGDATIHAAAPFAFRGSALDRSRALTCLTDAVYYEAATEPDDGQRAVAQVVLNRVRHPAFPGTVCGVVFQGSEQHGCQFSFACDGSMLRGQPSRAFWTRAQRVAAAALAGAVFAPVGEATHYHSYAVTPAWNRALVMTGAFGAHFFHRWKGWWGTPAAFSRVYRGNEPVPGPHLPAEPPVQPIAPLPAPVVAQTGRPAPVPTPAPAPAPRSAIQPDHVESGTPTRDYTAAASESQILDKWKDSGKPLR